MTAPSLPALTRVCRGACGLSLPETAFARQGSDRLRGRCIACDSAHRTARYRREPAYRAAVLQTNRKCNAAHADKRRAGAAAYREANREQINRRARLRQARRAGQRDTDCQSAGGFALYENAAGRIYHLPCGLPLPRGKTAVERWGYWGEDCDDKPVWRREK